MKRFFALLVFVTSICASATELKSIGCYWMKSEVFNNGQIVSHGSSAHIFQNQLRLDVDVHKSWLTIVDPWSFNPLLSGSEGCDEFHSKPGMICFEQHSERYLNAYISADLFTDAHEGDVIIQSPAGIPATSTAEDTYHCQK